MSTVIETEVLEEVEVSTNTGEPVKLVLWNDDFNTFEHVIECLIKYIKKTFEEADAIAWAVHTKGKFILLEGARPNLVEYYNILKFKGLTVSLD